ncbi:Major facilitator superfamily domain, general substrate transporter [Artemisia annua]|uniref:Major facilitator superfamily domain, general substrate transporter n=1 Tax=Artemisia annua TaxID=35608 RepID=A0A2U1PGZ4_ARTAN|nr:Major facilitator superfamily domain, general substrate transporter [Artemisia annua]
MFRDPLRPTLVAIAGRLSGNTKGLTELQRMGVRLIIGLFAMLNFFNSQAPDGIKSFGSSLCMMLISLGNHVSSLIVHMVMSITAKGDEVGSIHENLNDGHMERFYFLIAILTVFDFVLYVYCVKRYKCMSVEENGNKPNKEQV